MRKQYDLDAPMHQVLATLQTPGSEEEAQTHGEEEEPATIHVYPVAGGGILFSRVPLDQEEAPIVESQAPDTEIPLTKHTTTRAKERPGFLPFLLILGFFLLFDMADSQVTALLTPSITVTITPKAHTITTTATFPIGADGNGVPGRVLPELTLTQTQTTQATGKGHQDARAASGILTFYNGLFTAQSLPRGSVFVGQDGVKVATTESVTIPAANPPQFAEVSVSAYAMKAGSSGSIGAGDINTTIANGVLVKNSQFVGGQDARDFLYVTKADIQRVVDNLAPHLLQSEQAALITQLGEGDALAPPTCTPTTTADHGIGSEATTVQVTISTSCLGVSYNQQAVQVQATQLLTRIATQQVGTGYTLTGAIHVTLNKPGVTPHIQLMVISFTCTGTWVYTLSPQEQQQIKQLIAGRTKHDALQLLRSQQGIASVTIAGVLDNQALPQDFTHIHLLLLFGMA